MSAPSPQSCPACGGAVPRGLGVCARCLVADDLHPRDRLGTFEIQELLGKGGMGEVYRARDVRLSRTVAVKFLPEALCASAEARARFEREAHALARLSHPNIVTLHEAGEAEGQPYLVMELVEGPSLAGMLPLPREEALRIAVQVCDALAYAHERGVVHRDIKPANVLLDGRGGVKLADFGIARLVGADVSRVTATQVVVGTPQYLAPEALRGAPPDPRMDVYSVGVLLYELVTGRLPVGAFSALDATLDPIVRRALADDPARRFASARELGDALRAAAAAPGDELPEDERMWIRATALVCAVAAGFTFFAGVVSLTPRIAEGNEPPPLTALFYEELPNGQRVSRARFEVVPTLLAALAGGAAFAAYAMLRRHWRISGLDVPRPQEPVPGAWRVLAAGVGACLLYGARRALELSGVVAATVYVPVIGGFFELWVMYLSFAVLLEARRRSRPLLREPLLWSGLALALIPPVLEFFTYVTQWRP